MLSKAKCSYSAVNPCGKFHLFRLLLLAILLFVVSNYVRTHSKTESEVTVTNEKRPPKTTIPIYYVNLDRSRFRRLHMERTFGSWGTLIRVPSVDAANGTEINEVIYLNGMSLEQYKEAGKLYSGTGGVALMASHMRAVKMAYKAGNEIMLLVEDDLSDTLAPFWRFGIDDVVKMANEGTHSEDWDIIQLQALFGERQAYDAWKVLSGPLVAHRMMPLGMRKSSWGCGAQLIHRRGMEKLLELFVHEDGKMDCLPMVEKYARTRRNVQCIPDNLYWKIDELDSWIIMPPMFNQMLNEGSTGIRSNGFQRDKSTNDHYGRHYLRFFDNVKANIEAFSSFNRERDMGPKSGLAPYLDQIYSFEDTGMTRAKLLSYWEGNFTKMMPK